MLLPAPTALFRVILSIAPYADFLPRDISPFFVVLTLMAVLGVEYVFDHSRLSERS